MYKLEKPRRDHNKLQSPSFSSTLLDQIYRSIDDGQSKSSESNFYRETTTTTTSKRHWTEKKDRTDNNNNNKVRSKNVAVVEETNNRKFHHDHDPDVLFFSSTSISSDTSSGGFSSSDTDSTWPRPVRTSASFRWENEKHATRVQSFMHLTAQHKHGVTGVRDEEALIKSKSRALKIYNNLKKIKQPVSPGGKLTSFLNSLFATGEAKKKKKKNDEIVERRVNSGLGSSSTCCSASSFSRSCLSKVSSCDRENMSNGVKRTVRFYPETVEEKKIVVEKAAREFLREYRYNNQNKKTDLVLKDLSLRKNANYSEEHEEEDYDDAASYASSDLFELDHLAVLGNGLYDEELPVFETTHFSSNPTIANGIRV
ncbi:protein BIG GRAIN 1-like B [Lotus japonicus]|uniref:protein BIG GRAIN 1-like B n=1 Tax=Lotus japonicus TaxID=34305 RepID=UPI002587B589|nr:protein BIG GRAIN 1-like B [Lotus japonicus]